MMTNDRFPDDSRRVPFRRHHAQLQAYARGTSRPDRAEATAWAVVTARLDEGARPARVKPALWRTAFVAASVAALCVWVQVQSAPRASAANDGAGGAEGIGGAETGAAGARGRGG